MSHLNVKCDTQNSIPWGIAGFHEMIPGEDPGDPSPKEREIDCLAKNILPWLVFNSVGLTVPCARSQQNSMTNNGYRAGGTSLIPTRPTDSGICVFVTH
jgi:hypothetical protein